MSQKNVEPFQPEIFKVSIPPELLTGYRIAAAEVATNSEEVTRLAGKIQSVTDGLPSLAAAVDHAEKIKNDVLSAHAIDIATAAELETARNNHAAAVKIFHETEELLNAIEKSWKQAEGKIPKLNNAKQDARKKVYREYQSQLLDEIRKRVGDLFIYADVAARVLGADYAGNPFKLVNPAQVREITQEIEAELFQ
ncbi:MAG: hypothetical protein ACOYL3_16410 [Desulfuromonadaceae bacterium]